jgi:hypothetical protein
MTRLNATLRSLVRQPAVELRWKKQRLEQALRRRELLRAARRSLRPIRVPETDRSAIHVLAGTRTVLDGVWMLTSLFRQIEERYPVVVHDDGSLTEGDHAILTTLFPGLRVIARPDADRIVNPMLERQGLARCLALRGSYVPSLKLFDLQVFGRDRRILYVDTDVLFFQRPDRLCQLMARGADDAGTWYNVDIADWYTWPPAVLAERIGVTVPSRVNTGVFCAPVDLLPWRLYETCLGIRDAMVNPWHVEQTLWAVQYGSTGASPLPEDEYDVHHRHGWAGMDRARALKDRDHGAPVVSQHYSGGWAYRQMFYDALRAGFFEPAAAG